jgi:hypothetical protein
MKDNVLRFNSIENSNDPNEYKEINPAFIYDPENYPIGDTEHMLETGLQLNKIIGKTKMVCFSTNEFDIFSRTIREGWDLPRMWHSYGDFHKGVCIQINNDLLIQENLDVFNSPYVFKDVVNYSRNLKYPILRKDKFDNDE